MTISKDTELSRSGGRRFFKKITTDFYLFEALENPFYTEKVLHELTARASFLKQAAKHSSTFLRLLDRYPPHRPKLIKKILHHTSLFKRVVVDYNVFVTIANYNIYQDRLITKLSDHPNVLCKVVNSNLQFKKFLQTFPTYIDQLFNTLLKQEKLLSTVIKNVDYFIELLKSYPKYLEALMQKLLNEESFFALIVKQYADLLLLIKSYPDYQVPLAQKILIAEKNGLSNFFPSFSEFNQILEQFPNLRKMLLEGVLNNENLYLRYVRGFSSNIAPLETIVCFTEGKIAENIDKFPEYSKSIWQAELLYVLPILLKRAVLDESYYAMTQVKNFIKALIHNHRLEFSVMKFILPLINQTLDPIALQQAKNPLYIQTKLESIKKLLLQNQKLSLVDLCIDKLKSRWQNNLVLPEELKERATNFLSPSCTVNKIS